MEETGVYVHGRASHQLESAGEKPVFVGHYWLTGEPVLPASNVACVDYSVAREGLLVAYRWDGESDLNEDKFVTVNSKQGSS
jgi:hypothetical protein